MSLLAVIIEIQSGRTVRQYDKVVALRNISEPQIQRIYTNQHLHNGEVDHIYETE